MTLTLRIVVLLGVLLAAAPAAAEEPTRPLGAFRIFGDLTLNGPSPKNRAGVDLIVYLRQRVGIYAAAQQVMLSPFGDAGQVTAGIAYRAAGARPKLDLVLHGDAGVTWPFAPTAGGGVTTYFWPLKKVPVALTTGTNVYLVIDGVDDTRIVVAFSLGLALAR